MRAQRGCEDWEMEQLVWEVQMHAEEEHRREEKRRIGEQKQIAEDAEWQRRLVELWQVVEEVWEDNDEDDDEDDNIWGAGPSAPKKRKYKDKVSNNGE